MAATRGGGARVWGGRVGTLKVLVSFLSHQGVSKGVVTIRFMYLKIALVPVIGLRAGLPLGGQEPCDEASATSVSMKIQNS